MPPPPCLGGVDGLLFSSAEDEARACHARRRALLSPPSSEAAAAGGYGRRRLLASDDDDDSYTATTVVRRYAQEFELLGDVGTVGAMMAVEWALTAGSAAWGYKSILDPPGADGGDDAKRARDVAVTDGATGAPLDFEPYFNGGGWTLVKFWFSAELLPGDAATAVVSYVIDAATRCAEGGAAERFGLNWASYWRCDVHDITYSFTLPAAAPPAARACGSSEGGDGAWRDDRGGDGDDGDGADDDYGALTSAPDASGGSSGDAAVAGATCSGGGALVLTQRYTADVLAIGTSPRGAYFEWSPPSAAVAARCDGGAGGDGGVAVAIVVAAIGALVVAACVIGRRWRRRDDGGGGDGNNGDGCGSESLDGSPVVVVRVAVVAPEARGDRDGAAAGRGGGSGGAGRRGGGGGGSSAGAAARGGDSPRKF